MNSQCHLYICLNLIVASTTYGFLEPLSAENIPTDSQLNPPPSLVLPANTPDFSGQITVSGFEFQGQTVLSVVELGTIALTGDGQTISSVRDRPFTLSELLQVASQVADFYAAEGYKTSGAIIVIPEETQKAKRGKVIIKVVEGTLEEIRISQASDVKTTGNLDNYVRSRLGVKPNRPLNVDSLLEALQLLQIDPLIEKVTAKLSAGTTQGTNILEISYTSAKSLSLSINLDNNRSPSVGTFQRAISLREKNLSGLGDTFKIGFSNTDGSDRVDFDYEVPINSQNGTLEFSYVYSNNGVVEPPFEDLNLDGKSPDITSEFNNYKLSLRQPIIRGIQDGKFKEFALGISAELRETKSFLFGEPFPLSLGADISGQTKLFILHLTQDYTQQGLQESFALLSEFSLGLSAFGATIARKTEVETEKPDGEFFSWRGQVQYVKLLAPDTSLLFRSSLQLANTLVSSEQFSVGGSSTVRGYRQDLLLTDSGFSLSAEARLPIWRSRDRQSILQLIPFADYGIGWSSNGEAINRNSLASIGLGLLWQQENFSAKLEWGIPLVNAEERKRTWQESGLYFNIEYRPF